MPRAKPKLVTQRVESVLPKRGKVYIQCTFDPCDPNVGICEAEAVETLARLKKLGWTNITAAWEGGDKDICADAYGDCPLHAPRLFEE